MMYLFGYLIIAILLVFSCQTAAENECQKDPIETGQELLDTAPTLFNGIKSGSFGGEMAIKFLKKYAFGILCCQKIEPKFEMNENFKILQNNFCQQLKNGKSMEEAAENVESSAINLMQNLDKSKILKNISQKIAQNLFLDEENKEKIAKLLEHFQIGIDKFHTNKISSNQHKHGYKNALLSRRRRKRADEEQGGGGIGIKGWCIVMLTMVIQLTIWTLFGLAITVGGLPVMSPIPLLLLALAALNGPIAFCVNTCC
ncbi:hypothetical protein GPALN_016349 [Globodera pallida]|nr:hypothetical protein GPALN_016349 [Globodera pallida]